MRLRSAAVVLSLVLLTGCGPGASTAAAPQPTPPTFDVPVPTFTPSFDAPTTAVATDPDPSPRPGPDEVAPVEPPAIEPPALADVGASSLLAAIDTLLVLGEIHEDHYNRNLFGGAWIDADADGCTTRCEVLKAERVTFSDGTTGWLSLYDNYPVTNEADLDVDHMVPLAEAWRSGAWAWEPQRRIAFANDLDEPGALLAVTAVTNRAKGASDPTRWKPANDAAWCDYVDAWVATKLKWELTADPAEIAALREMVVAQSC